jgi:pyridoxamine 5'-phosphate oxidase
MKQLPEMLPDNPLPIVRQWLDRARNNGGYPNPDAMALATVSSNGQPTNRVVLCKQIVDDPGYLVFYTNYESAKANDIASRNSVAAVFHWDHLNRQVRLEGAVEKSPPEESDAYFASRDRESQVGAWASAQSEPIEERAQLLRALEAMNRRFADGQTIPRPPHWGGYRIWLTAVELWVRGDARLHDRGRWQRTLGDVAAEGGFQPQAWSSCRLQP